MLKRVHVIFSGQVQGVGFRFTARSIAVKLGVTGWVRNGSAGEVEIVAEHNEAVLKDFVDQLEKEFAGYIQDKQVMQEDAIGEFKDFGIRF